MSDTFEEVADDWLRQALNLSNGETPFPWQTQLLERFRHGAIERALDIPTGLGKTGVMAIWLVARARGAPLPRRLVYVVDRRAVVDQATDVAEELRRFVDENPQIKSALGLKDRSLPISTLRGQHVDNKEWLEDPGAPAVIVGTVDMIGSRLLFEGFGTSRKMRPYHAGLLGADALVVLDEAHLVPPFEKLIEAISEGITTFGPQDEALRPLIPRFALLSLSATGRLTAGNTPFGLKHEDLEHPIARRRLDAPKQLALTCLDTQTKLENALAEHAWKLTDHGRRPLRIIVFCDRREMAEATKAVIERLAKGDKKTGIAQIQIDAELFVGGRRVLEREHAARWLESQGFIAGTKTKRTQPAFVFSTSAGEVGVDLDADHMVCDLVAWERMVQRLGRVNRRGDGKAQVIVMAEAPSQEVEKAREKAREDLNRKELRAIADAERREAVHQLVNHLPTRDGARDASPGALRTLQLTARSDADLRKLLETATTPAPLRPALSRALIDAWSMTSLKEHTGRPEVDPWLRGWIDDPPQTAVVWRTHLPVRVLPGHPPAETQKDIEAFFEAAPPHMSEVLETDTFRIVEWLAARAKSLGQRGAALGTGEMNTDRAPLGADDIVAIALTPAGDLRRTLRLDDIHLDGTSDAKKRKEKKQALDACLTGATLVVDARLGGLNADGLLDEERNEPPQTVDDGASWASAASRQRGATTNVSVVPFRIRSVDAATLRERSPNLHESFRFATHLSDDGEPIRWLIVENAASEERRSTGVPQLLEEHQELTEVHARELARCVDLSPEYTEVVALAAGLHDEGKRSKRWQRAFNANIDGRVYAKTRGPINYALLNGYRHEFGSLRVAAIDARFARLPGHLQDLVLHLIAAHHGHARPVIGITGCEDATPSALEERGREVALRFARLQKRWGPWGLAWWEALLRAADQQASRANEVTGAAAVKRVSDG